MDETNSKSKELTVIKGHMVNVISNLQSTHQLEEIMPLLNLLKILENYINSLNTGEVWNWKPAVETNEMTLKLGPETIKITEKISFLLNRIHIESAYLASINKSVVFGIKQYYKRKNINQFVQQKTYSMEKRKLFVLSLKLILRDHESINTTGLNLNFLTTLLLENIDSGIGSLMKLINKNCEVCGGIPKLAGVVASSPGKPSPFCFCQVTLDHSLDSKRHTGLLRFNLFGFMGIYEAEYLDRMLNDNAYRLSIDQFSSDGSSKVRRRCVLIVRDQFAHSSWTSSALTLSGELAVHKAKEVEIQVWQASCKQQAPHDRIVAVAIVPLDSLLTVPETGNHSRGSTSTKSVTVSLEPQGFVICEMSLEQSGSGAGPMDQAVADNRQPPPVYKKFAIKRRENIFTKLGGYRLARHIEANVPVSLWTEWFKDHIDRLAIPIELERQKAAEKLAKDNKITCLCGSVKRFVRKALRVTKLHKVAITPAYSSLMTSTPQSARTGKKQRPFIESYQKLDESPACWQNRSRPNAKTNQSNPRPICKVVRTDQIESMARKNPVHSQSNGGLAPSISPIKMIKEKTKSRVEDLLAGSRKSEDDSFSVLKKQQQQQCEEPACDDAPCAPEPATNQWQHGLFKCVEELKSNQLQLARKPSVVCSNIELVVGERAHIYSQTPPEMELATATPTRAHRGKVANKTPNRDSVRYESEGGDSSDGECGWRQANMFSKSVLQSPFSLDGGLDLLPVGMSSPHLSEFGDDDEADKENRDRSLDRLQPAAAAAAHRRYHANGSEWGRSSSVIGGDRSVRCCSRAHREAWSDDEEEEEGDDNERSSEQLVMNSYRAGMGHVGDPVAGRSQDPSYQLEHHEPDSATDDGQDEDGLPSSKQTKNRPMAFEDLELISVLGLGHFGRVLLVRHVKRNILCAVKSIQKCRACEEPEYESLMSEKSILTIVTKSRHPFLVGLIGCFQTDRYLLFAMEYAPGGDLMGHVHKSPFPESDAKFYIACVILAIEFLHSKNIVFRDLKLDNVLMDRRGFAKLTDFGLSKENMHWDDFTTTFCGTPEFLAPEIISMQEYTRAIDWWALGVLFYEMVVGESPFPGDEDDEIFTAILETTPPPKNLSPEALSLVMRLLKHNPEKRLGYGEHGATNVKAHQFFKDMNWERLLRRRVRPPFFPELDSVTDTQYFEAEFTEKELTIEHDEEVDVEIDDALFRGFDTCQQWPSTSDLGDYNNDDDDLEPETFT